MWTGVVVFLLLVFTAGGDERNVTFLLGTDEGIIMSNSASVDSLDRIYPDRGVWAVDYHLERNLVYFLSDATLYKGSLVPTTHPLSSQPSEVSKMSSCNWFAVDWVHNVIYWVNCFFNSLMLMDLDGKGHTTVLQNIAHRKSIKKVEVDPHVGKVFWLAGGILEWSDLTGNNYHTNISQPGVYVTSFTLDTTASRLLYVGTFNNSTSLYEVVYSADGMYGLIERPSSPQVGYVHDLAVLGNHLFWVKNDNKEVMYSQKLNTTHEPETIRTINKHINQIRVVDPDLQKPFRGNPCRQTNCSHFCVHQRGVARCLCPDGMMAVNNTTCFGGDNRIVKILVGTADGVSMITGDDEFLTSIGFTTLGVNTIDYHLERDMVYFYSNDTLYRNPFFPSNSTVYTLVKEMGICQGFAVDWVHNVIYWMDCSTNSLKLMDLEGNNVTTVMKRPGSWAWIGRMAVDPHVGKVFWVAGGSLEWCDLTGEHFKTNLSNPRLTTRIFTLDIPTSRLFYIHSSTLYEMSYSSDGIVTTKQTMSPLLQDVHSISVLGLYMYCSTYSYPSSSIYRILTTMAGRPEPIRRIESVIDMRVVDPELQKPYSEHPCQQTTCSHFCVHQRGVARCLCPDGMRLDNNSTCFAPV